MPERRPASPADPNASAASRRFPTELPADTRAELPPRAGRPLSNGRVTGSSGGQQPAETRPHEADAGTSTGPQAPVPHAGPATDGRPGADARLARDEGPGAGAGPPVGVESVRGTLPPADPGARPESAPPSDPGRQSEIEPPQSEIEPPTPAGPFAGAGPVGSPWLAAPTTTPVSTGIEPTTGAPIAMLPQRAPQVTVPAGSPAWDGPTTPVRITVPGHAPDPDDDDGDDFWLPIEEVHWDGTPVEPTPRTWFGRPRSSPANGAVPRPPMPPKPPRSPALGLAGTVLLALVASFFAWVSAEPLWLAVGHGDRGTAIVASCTGHGIGQHCRGEFTAASGTFTARDVRLVGVNAAGRANGAQLPARMIAADAQKAYVGAGTGLLHLRWALGLGLVLLCGVGIGWASGALRLPERRSRHRAALASLAGPLLLTAGFLAAAF